MKRTPKRKPNPKKDPKRKTKKIEFPTREDTRKVIVLPRRPRLKNPNRKGLYNPNLDPIGEIGQSI